MADRYTALLVVGRLQSHLDRIFDEVAQSLAGGIEVPEWQPAVDVVETDSEVTVFVEVPGVSAEQLEVQVSGNAVVVRGERSADGAPGKGGRFLCVETGRGRFQREVQLLHPVNSHRGRAALRDGVLQVTFPRIEDLRQQPRLVPIQCAVSDPASDHDQEA